MECPKCRIKMDKGNLTSSGFAPGPVINKKIFWKGKKGKIKLNKECDSYRCDKCGMIIILS